MAQSENQIGVVGGGLIGLSWASLFSAFGYETIVYDPYLKEQNLYDMLLNEVREIPEIEDEPYMTCFGMSVYEKDGELVSEDNYAKTL